MGAGGCRGQGQGSPLMLKALAVVVLSLVASHVLAAEPSTLRIGYQKSSVSMVLAREHKLFEDALPGTQVQWIEFLGGPPLIEALNGGSLDIGNIGDIPPIFAQAAGIDLQYFAVEPNEGKTEAVLVPKASPIQHVAELKGKRVALLGFQRTQPVPQEPAARRFAVEGCRRGVPVAVRWPCRV